MGQSQSTEPIKTPQKKNKSTLPLSTSLSNNLLTNKEVELLKQFYNKIFINNQLIPFTQFLLIWVNNSNKIFSFNYIKKQKKLLNNITNNNNDEDIEEDEDNELFFYITSMSYANGLNNNSSSSPTSPTSKSNGSSPNATSVPNFPISTEYFYKPFIKAIYNYFSSFSAQFTYQIFEHFICNSIRVSNTQSLKNLLVLSYYLPDKYIDSVINYNDEIIENNSNYLKEYPEELTMITEFNKNYKNNPNKINLNAKENEFYYTKYNNTSNSTSSTSSIPSDGLTLLFFYKFLFIISLLANNPKLNRNYIKVLIIKFNEFFLYNTKSLTLTNNLLVILNNISFSDLLSSISNGSTTSTNSSASASFKYLNILLGLINENLPFISKAYQIYVSTRLLNTHIYSASFKPFCPVNLLDDSDALSYQIKQVKKEEKNHKNEQNLEQEEEKDENLDETELRKKKNKELKERYIKNLNFAYGTNWLSVLSLSREELQGQWKRLYSTTTDGISFNRIVHHISGYDGPTCVLIKCSDVKGCVFGFLTTERWKELNRFYGNYLFIIFFIIFSHLF